MKGRSCRCLCWIYLADADILRDFKGIWGTVAFSLTVFNIQSPVGIWVNTCMDTQPSVIFITVDAVLCFLDGKTGASCFLLAAN